MGVYVMVGVKTNKRQQIDKELLICGINTFRYGMDFQSKSSTVMDIKTGTFMSIQAILVVFMLQAMTSASLTNYPDLAKSIVYLVGVALAVSIIINLRVCALALKARKTRTGTLRKGTFDNLYLYEKSEVVINEIYQKTSIAYEKNRVQQKKKEKLFIKAQRFWVINLIWSLSFALAFFVIELFYG